MNQISFKVIGNGLRVTLAAEAGQLELNVMEPVIAQAIVASAAILKSGMTVQRAKCVTGITANTMCCRAMVQRSIGLVTALNPVLGYNVCTGLAKEASATGKGVYELVFEKKLLSRKELDHLLAPENMIRPHRIGGEERARPVRE
jgi:aspartate ammonia-lyase